MEINEFCRKQTDRSREIYPHCYYSWTASDWGVALAGEAGGVCDAIKKLNRKSVIGAETDEKIKKIGHELADTMMYIASLAHHLGIDLEAACKEKFNLVSDKFNSEIKL